MSLSFVNLSKSILNLSLNTLVFLSKSKFETYLVLSKSSFFCSKLLKFHLKLALIKGLPEACLNFCLGLSISLFFFKGQFWQWWLLLKDFFMGFFVNLKFISFFFKLKKKTPYLLFRLNLSFTINVLFRIYLLFWLRNKRFLTFYSNNKFFIYSMLTNLGKLQKKNSYKSLSFIDLKFNNLIKVQKLRK